MHWQPLLPQSDSDFAWIFVIPPQFNVCLAQPLRLRRLITIKADGSHSLPQSLLHVGCMAAGREKGIGGKRQTDLSKLSDIFVFQALSISMEFGSLDLEVSWHDALARFGRFVVASREPLESTNWRSQVPSLLRRDLKRDSLSGGGERQFQLFKAALSKLHRSYPSRRGKKGQSRGIAKGV